MPRTRFSLRTLLLLTAAVAAFGYWRDRPRQLAHRFVAAIDAEDYAAAEVMLNRSDGVRAINTKWRVALGEQSWTDWLRGRYPLTAEATFGLNFYGTTLLEATATSIEYRGVWDSPDGRYRLLAPQG